MTAMAMSCRPDLIIFDEPTTALDVTTQVEVLAAMRNIVEQFHTAAIYITHDLAVVAQMADRIMVLRHGLEVEEADTREMLKEPKQDYTKTLWAVRKLAKEEAISDDVALQRAQRRCQLFRRGQGARQCHRAAAARPHGGGGGRIGLRQVDAGARHHRPAAADQGRDPVQRQAAAAQR